MTIIACGLYLHFHDYYADDSFGYLHCINNPHARYAAINYIVDDI